MSDKAETTTTSTTETTTVPTPPGTPEAKDEGTSSSPKTSGKKRQRKEYPKPAQTMETRNRKKAREAIDMVTGVHQRQESLINLLGSDYKEKEYTGPSEEQLKMMFRVFDRDNDGRIGSDELASVMRSMGKRPLTKKIQKMLDECDANKTGTIELAEFITYMKKKAAKKAESLRNKGKEKEEPEKEKEEVKEEEPKGKGKGKKAAAPKKGAAAKKAPASPKSPKGKGKKAAAAAETTTTSSVKRGDSLLDFYNPHAGVHEAPTAALDQHNNPIGAEFDLGVEGAFSQYSILVGMFYDPSTDGAKTVMNLPDFNKRVGGSLQTKGFGFTTVTTQKEFIDKLETHDIAWIISGTAADSTTTEDEFAEAVSKFHTTGGGLFVWADNQPFYVHANIVLKKLYNVELKGNTPAQKTLSAGDGNIKGQFAKHLITSGIKNLYEGRTVSYPTSVPADLGVLATSTDGNPVILYSQHTTSAGRVMVDCGFTKLWVEYDSAGTERYVKNANVWLLGLESRIATDAPLIGKLVVPVNKVQKPVWQFKHGTWHDYDDAASQVVEEAYQDWLKNPYIDVRAVKSGFWQYQVDFKQMHQTNIQHTNHTTREVRRELRDVAV